MGSYDAIVVGAGIVGAASAHALARKGLKVALLDQYDIPNEWAASGDHARVFRLTYGKDLFYTELALKALNLWKEFQKEAREEFYVPTGLLDLAVRDGGYEEACFRSLSELKIPVHKLGAADMKERYRIFNVRAMRYAVFHPDGGMIWAQRATTAFASAARRHRAVLSPRTKIQSVLRGKDGIRELKDDKGRSWRASTYVFSAGAWTRELLAAYRLPIRPTRQQLLYFRPPLNLGRFRPAHLPVFSCHSSGYYGFPVHIHGFMKVGLHRKGPSGKPGPGPQDPPQPFIRSCRAFLKRFLPDVSGFVETEGKVCWYDNTPDGDFIIDRLPDCPNGIVAAGFSGHGFKFGPLVGELVAQLLVNGKTDINLGRFRAGRFRKKG